MNMSDLVTELSNSLLFLSDHAENSIPKVLYRKYRFKGKFKKSKRFFYTNEFDNILFDMLPIHFCYKFLKNKLT